jgi:hypothetical protein
MPRILNNIDQIALEKQRDVLYLLYHKSYNDSFHNEDLSLKFHYETCIARQQLIEWLEKHEIDFSECFGWSTRSGIMSMPYLGELYLDVPFDEADPKYQLLYNYLENSDGSKLTKTTKHAKRHFWLTDVCTCHGLLPSHSA